jgi:hypothetical protein
VRLYLILISFLLVSCETPTGAQSGNGPLRWTHKPGSGLHQRRKPRKSFDEKFQENVLNNGLASAVNGAVTVNYPGAECHKVGLTYTVSEIKDSTEIDQMIETAFNSDNSCKRVFTGNKGNTSTAGLPYAKTFAYSMIQDMCNPEMAGIGKNLSMPSFGSKDILSLSHFNKGSTSKSDPKNLATTYALVYALGQRESDGDFKRGRDTSANNKSAATEEAGMFQVSANSLNLGKGKTEGFLKNIFRSFVGELSKSNSSKKGELCLTSKIQGTKETRSPATENDLQVLFTSSSCKGAASIVKSSKYSSTKVASCFRKLTKSCPSFAIKYAAGVARVNRAHNGPLVTHSELRSRGLKSAKYHKPYPKPACHSVFQSIISNKSKVCAAK